MVANFSAKKRIFNKIVEDIKSIKIQGARDISKSALKAYSLIPTSSSKNKLLGLRPTEPMLHRVLDLADKIPKEEIFNHFDNSQEKINKNVLALIKRSDRIFIHCHSTNVINALIYAKKKGKKFEVYNTETRPLFQGRKTSKELSKAGIKVTQFVDSAMALILEKENRKDEIYANKVFLGADALTKKGVINKIGSKTIAELVFINKIPLYIVADSWKFSNRPVPIEQRDLNEIWDKAPKKIKLQNPAFEFVPKKYITKIVTEFGVLKFDEFLRKIKKI